MLFSKEVHKLIKEKGYYFFDEDRGETALHKSCRGGEKDIVSTLLTKDFNINLVNTNEQTPLHIAVWHKHKDIVRMLLAKDAEINLQEINKRTPLHFAAKRELEEITEFLLCFGAKTNQLDKNNETALHIAFRMKNRNLAEMLLDSKVNFNIINKSNQTALDIALSNRSGRMQMVMVSFVVLQLKLSESEISERILRTLNSTQKLRNMQIMCEKDLDTLQKMFVIRNVSCFKLLTEPHKKLAKLLNNNEIRHSLEKHILQYSFLSYTTFMTCHFRRALRIQQYKKNLTGMLKDILKCLPIECIIHIIECFSEKELIVLADCFNLDRYSKESVMKDIFTRDFVVI